MLRGRRHSIADNSDYLTFTCIGSGDFLHIVKVGTLSPNIQYSINGGTWYTFTSDVSIYTEIGYVIKVKGINPTGLSLSDSDYLNIYSTARFNASGNIMSLIDGQKNGTKVIPNSYCFYRLFYDFTGLVTAPELPAITLADYCYNEMFGECTNLTSAPALPATVLAEGCYSGMFWYSGLTTAPALPATTLADYCYAYMFADSNLTTAPVLHATTLVEGCYKELFMGCVELTTAPELSTTTLANSCYSEMFYGCINLVNAPTLPSSTLEEYCYEYMFNGCTSLNNIKCLATNLSAENCLTDWMEGVSSTGTFTKSQGVQWPNGDSGIPEGWTVIEQ